MGELRRGAADARIAILSAEPGGHVEALLEDPVVAQWIALVIAERPDSSALRHAEGHGVATTVLRAGKSYLDLFDLALVRVLKEHAIDYVVVTGFRRIVGTATVHAYPDRVVKVHHSLLPEFPGPDPVAEALANGATKTGVTVHLIGPDLEVGPVVVQEALEINDDETWHSLVERMHTLELRLLPEAMHALVEGAR
jgi:phosphoribosylglycinamide formyltransferase 1